MDDERLYWKAKYDALVNVLLDVAKYNASPGKLYTFNDGEIYTVLKALEPQRYAYRLNELKALEEE